MPTKSPGEEFDVYNDELYVMGVDGWCTGFEKRRLIAC